MITINSVLVIGGLGLIFGIILSYAGKKLKVEVNPKIESVRDALPGANCGGCGYTGCDPFAEAVVNNEAKPSGCPVGGDSTTEAICNILGIEPTTEAPKTAFVKCNGNCNVAPNKYDYYGIDDCNIAAQLAGDTPKICKHGCMGLGSCVKACEFDAIDIVDGVAIINKEKCVACGACTVVCPKLLIDIVPALSTIHVTCNSTDKGATVKKSCEVGCIGCKLCVKSCNFDAINVTKFLATIDYDKCKLCTLCVKKCPTGAIIHQKKLKVEVDEKPKAVKKAKVDKELASDEKPKAVKKTKVVKELVSDEKPKAVKKAKVDKELDSTSK